MGLRYSIYIENPLSSPSSSYKSINDPLFHSQHRSQKNVSFITYGCRHCKTHLSSSFQIISRDYRGRTGTAYLMNKVVNVVEGKVEQRRMLNGDYLVCDILCHWCKSWKTFVNVLDVFLCLLSSTSRLLVLFSVWFFLRIWSFFLLFWLGIFLFVFHYWSGLIGFWFGPVVFK